MEKSELVFLTPAMTDIEQIADYYLYQAGVQSAENITTKIMDTIDILSDSPYAGAEHPDPVLQQRGFRKLVCGEYICVYKVEAPQIIIYRIVHGATDYPRLLY